jgi:predicted ATPase/class 3 adenylate cyclase
VADSELPSGTVTFLFTDLEGSTRLWEEHPDTMQAALARHDELVRDAIEAHRGQVVKTTGDGFHAVFSSARDALDAAIAAQRTLGAEPWEKTGPLCVRMGLHTGEGEQREGDYYGPALNRAARIMSAGHGGQVLCSRPTADLAGEALPEGCSLVDLGEQRLRDLSRPEVVFQVVHPELRSAFPPLQSLDAFPGNLPPQLTSFVGRDAELADIGEALDTSRLVTLTGVGGVGKTRLALHVAAELLPRFADGVWFCELAAAGDDDMLAQVIVASLGMQPRPGRTLAESVCDYLAPKQALIVLDNCEHLLDAAAAMAEAILRAAPGVRVLATSREGLAVAGEQVWPVRSLRVASEPSLEAIAACEAVRLFGERAGSARPSFVVDATNATAVSEICRRLDGIPLAVELAAARVTSMSPVEIAGLLDDRFRLLTGGRRRGVERHQTLRATVEWSYSLLDARERVVFDHLGVFAGSFDADAATAVAGDDGLAAWDVRDALDDLVAKSMVGLDDGPDGTTRYRLLETLRQYALERLDDTGQAEEHRRRHAEHYAAFAEVTGPGLEGPDEATWFPRFDADLDNLRAAAAWSLDARDAADGEPGLRIIAALVRQVFVRPAAGVGEWAEAALERAETSTPGRRTAVLTAAAWKAIFDGDVDLAQARGAEALRDGLPPDTPCPGFGFAALASSSATAGDREAALETIAAGRSALDAIGADHAARLVLDVSGVVVLIFAGRYDEARVAADELLQRARTLGNPSLLTQALRWFAQTRQSDETDAAIEATEEGQAHGRAVAVSDNPDVVNALALLAKLRAGRGEHAPAITALREGIVRGYDTGQVPNLLSYTLGYGVSAATNLGAWELAATLGGALTGGPLVWMVYGDPAHVAERDAALDRARVQLGPERYDAAHATGAAMSYEELIAYTLAELDGLLAEAGDG